jgi:hypothetical protein
MATNNTVSKTILLFYRKERFFIVIFSFVLYYICYFTSCTYISEEELLKDVPCDTTNISYNDLTYIFSGTCSTCHSTVFTYKPGIVMDTYTGVRTSIQTGLVLPAINHVDGVPPMPSGMPKLTACEINKIEAWVNAGMPENK